jgi:error-prone DNA polymerase
MPEIHEKPRVGRGEDDEGPLLPPILRVSTYDLRASTHGLPTNTQDPPGQAPGMPGYAELHCISNFSFQRGASHPQELVQQAYNLGYEALAITDECSVAGVVRAFSGLKDHYERIARLEKKFPDEPRRRDFKLLFGSEFALDGGRLVAIARDLAGWGGLCEFITAARIEEVKGTYRVGWDVSDFTQLRGCEILWAPGRLQQVSGSEGMNVSALCTRLEKLKTMYGQHLWLAVELSSQIDDDLWLAMLREAGQRCGVQMVASGDVHMHKRSRKRLHDVITAVRVGKPVAECGFELQVNAERYLRPRLRLAETHTEDLLANTLEVMRRCNFDLKEVQYNYPMESLPPGLTPTQALRELTFHCAHVMYPKGIPQRIKDWLEKELALITACNYEMYFLTVHDIVRFARSQGILCQGRGSAANSVVCWCLGITVADPEHSHPLLERFISMERRNEPPDIDVDFEHERREEVIQYIYKKYGRERAAIAAVVISYRTRSAIRDVGKALALPEVLIDAFAREHHWFDNELAWQSLQELAVKCGVTLDLRQAQLWLGLTWQLMGFPRHLSQHVGGFVLTQTRLTSLVPVENAAMPDRSIIQWDKDDLEDMGLMKVDVLALGMLTAIRRCIDFVAERSQRPFTIYDIEDEDAPTYEMIRRADTVGVFQIESRAQMSMLPRLKPTTFYDLVVEVALVRPGPIVGGMVHPYLLARDRRRKGLPIAYERSSHEKPNEPPRLKKALERTLGIPIFQEQVMEISMIAAGFDGAEADGLRRSMAAWKRKGGVEKYAGRLINGMTDRGYSQDFAERVFEQIKGFGEYGFPESHAYSFALLAYKSSWLKCHEPECFLAAMINSQPMGFYNPSQLIQDAKRSGVRVLPPDVSHSDWDCTLTFDEHSRDHPLVRLGLRLVGSLSQAAGERIPQARAEGAFTSTEDLALRAGLGTKDINALAAADALMSLSGHRRQQVWDATTQRRTQTMARDLLRDAPVNETPLLLPEAGEGEEILFDYASMNLTLRRHPLALLRPRLARMRLQTADEMKQLPDGKLVRACGIVTMRQQPQTAGGTIFVTLEDETGPVNVIVWKGLREQQRSELLNSRLLAVYGKWQHDRESHVCHLVAQHLKDLTPLLGRLGQQSSKSRDFH